MTLGYFKMLKLSFWIKKYYLLPRTKIYQKCPNKSKLFRISITFPTFPFFPTFHPDKTTFLCTSNKFHQGQVHYQAKVVRSFGFHILWQHIIILFFVDLQRNSIMSFECSLFSGKCIQGLDTWKVSVRKIWNIRIHVNQAWKSHL